MRLMNKRLGIVLLLIVVIFLTSCQKTDSTKTKGEGNKNESVKEVGGEITIATKHIDTFNPIQNKDKDIDQMLGLIFDTLVRVDENMNVLPNLAESFKMDNVGGSIDVIIRQDIKFHNGKPLQVEDVIYTLDTIKREADDNYYKAMTADIGSYKKIDDKTLRVYLRQAHATASYALCFPVLSRETTKDHPVGTGRYMFDTMSSMQEVLLKRNPDYFNNPAYIETIKVMIVPDKKTAMQAFRQKQIDIMFTDDMIAGQYKSNKSVTMAEYATMYYDFLAFNFNNPTLSNAELRRVFAHSIHKEKIVADVYYGYAKVAETPVHPDSYLNAKSTTAYEYDTGLAKSLLKNLNLPAESLVFNLLVNSENTERKEIAQVIKNNMANIGITINIETINFNDYTARVNAKDFDLLLGGWHLNLSHELGFAFHSDEVSRKNFGSYHSDEMNELLLKSFTEIGEEKLKENYRKLQEFISRDLPYISLAFRENVGYINADKINGTLKPLEHNNFNGIENLTIKVK